jgi:hypothetical protein
MKKNERTIPPTKAFTKSLAQEIVKNLVAIGQFTARPFNREKDIKEVPESNRTSEIIQFW